MSNRFITEYWEEESLKSHEQIEKERRAYRLKKLRDDYLYMRREVEDMIPTIADEYKDWVKDHPRAYTETLEHYLESW